MLAPDPGVEGPYSKFIEKTFGDLELVPLFIEPKDLASLQERLRPHYVRDFDPMTSSPEWPGTKGDGASQGWIPTTEYHASRFLGSDPYSCWGIQPRGLDTSAPPHPCMPFQLGSSPGFDGFSLS